MGVNDIIYNNQKKELVSGTSHFPLVPFKFQNRVRAILQAVTTEYAIYKSTQELSHSSQISVTD